MINQSAKWCLHIAFIIIYITCKTYLNNAYTSKNWLTLAENLQININHMRKKLLTSF